MELTVPSQTQKPAGEVVKKFPKSKIVLLWPYIAGSILIVLVGVGAGWLFTSKGGGIGGSKTTIVPSKTGAKEAGIMDAKLYPDTVEGTLEQGGIKGEGSYHLTRPGGDSQTVYLTSTVLDMGNFVGQKVQIWGKSTSARYAPWLMEVGRIKVIE
jgi:hypothetical protein